ncbi:FtsX-like permease family protein [Microbacterium sp. Marseille-Q6965]|uniref:ABC transporter permease n=1 Tax=Microbacterium sp. Marseille-Q6965 TaxID=2965072 RepID=UPI0021B7A83E|nr:FtsX-like permease family protein [Microbacterium sp. Marseille-Q6965]
MSAVAAEPAALAPARRRSLAFLAERGMGASVLVSALSAAFGAILLATTGYLAALMTDTFPDSGTLVVMVGILSVIFMIIAMYVGAIVTSNTFATIVAGRTRRIALMRLIGASARSQRAEVAGQGLVVGIIGALLGVAAGGLLSVAGVLVAETLLDVPETDYVVLQPWLALPALAVALTTWAAAWAGSRRVLAVTPLQALGGSVERTAERARGGLGRNTAALVLLIAGGALLAVGVVLGLATPLAILVSFVGGLLSFTGLVLGATLVMPPVLRLVGRAFGGSAAARLAAENALRYPERSSRMAIGVVVGVTLVTMFAVASETAKAVMIANSGGAMADDFAAAMDMFAGVMMGLVAVSAVIAAVGLVNLLTIGVVQRRTELGLLRALGLSNPQVRRMVLLEAAHITIASLVLGLALGVAYGWAGAQSLLGSVASAPGAPAGFLVAPAVPWLPMAIVVAATAVLTLVASVGPTRLATRVAPVEALAAE